MKNLREHIKALLLLGDSPRDAIVSVAEQVRKGLTAPRDLSLFAALIEDALTLADDETNKHAVKVSKAKG